MAPDPREPACPEARTALARIGYLAHDLADPAIARRVRMFALGGADVALAGLLRGASPPALPDADALHIPGIGSARIRTGQRGRQFRLDLTAQNKDFVDWLAGQTPALIAELHERWKRSED